MLAKGGMIQLANHDKKELKMDGTVVKQLH